MPNTCQIPRIIHLINSINIVGNRSNKISWVSVNLCVPKITIVVLQSDSQPQVALLRVESLGYLHLMTRHHMTLSTIGNVWSDFVLISVCLYVSQINILFRKCNNLLQTALLHVRSLEIMPSMTLSNSIPPARRLLGSYVGCQLTLIVSNIIICANHVFSFGITRWSTNQNILLWCWFISWNVF